MDSPNNSPRHLHATNTMTLVEISHGDLEVELIENRSILKACAEKSLIGKIWSQEQVSKTHVYNIYKNFWSPTCKLFVSEFEEGFNTFIFSFQTLEDKKESMG